MEIDDLLTVAELEVNLAVLDSAGIIVGVNSNWKRFAQANGFALPDYGVGSPYLDNGTAATRTPLLRHQLGRLLAGESRVFTMMYDCHSSQEARWFLLIGLALSGTGRAGCALLHVNLTQLLPKVFSCRELPMDRTASGEQTVEITLDLIVDVVQRAVAAAFNAGEASQLYAAGAKRTPTDPARPQLGRLTERQHEIFAALGRGLTNAEIARELGVSLSTVKIHVSGILRELRLKSRTQAALLASRLVPPSDRDR
jgi:DNA-binding CsgD family transcriptional regulator